MMENLFQDLYGVDAPADWEVYSAPQSGTFNWFKGGLRGRREWGDYGRKSQKRKARAKLKGNKKGEEMGKGNNANC